MVGDVILMAEHSKVTDLPDWLTQGDGSEDGPHILTATQSENKKHLSVIGNRG